MSTTYLEAINDVLIRLRIPQVASVTETTYSTLIGKFINDAKRQVEDAFDWNVLRTVVTVTTTASTYAYSLTGAGQKFRTLNVLNTTSLVDMTGITYVDMDRYLNFTPVNSIPTFYIYNGVDSNYDTKINVFPIPNGVFSLRFSLVVPQASLSSGSTVIAVPAEIVQQNAYARALVERGEDGGMSSSEAYQLYKVMLSDYIALESSRHAENSMFIEV